MGAQIIMAQLFVMAGNKPIEIPPGWPLNTVVEFIPWVFIGFLIPLGAAFRLARFNIVALKNYFIGCQHLQWRCFLAHFLYW